MFRLRCCLQKRGLVSYQKRNALHVSRPPPRPCDCFITFSKIQLQNPYENEYSVLSHQIELQLVRGLKSLHFLQIFQSGLNKRLYCITFQKSYFLIVKFIFVFFFFDDHQYSYVCRQCYTAYINKILRHLGQINAIQQN